MQSELKPCPWCDQEPTSGTYEGVGFVGCGNNMCSVGPSVQYPTEAEAIEAWSRRVSRPGADGEAVAVKPLEWERIRLESEREYDLAKTSIGHYDIESDPFSYSPTTAYYVTGPDGYCSQHTTVPEAKAAAQADYEARIRSALAVPPAPVTEAPIKEANEALTNLADTFENFLADIGHSRESWQRDQIAEARRVSDRLTAALGTATAGTEERLPTREEAATAAQTLLRCNGADLSEWAGDDLWFDDGEAFLRALSVHMLAASPSPETEVE